MGKKLEVALNHLDELAGEPVRFRVSIPAQETDSDLILGAGFKEQAEQIEALEDEVERQEGIVLQLRDEITRRWADQPEVERLRGLLNEWVGQHASAEGLLVDTKAELEAGEDEPNG